MSVENHLVSLRSKHQALENSILAEERSPSQDHLKITDLKKQKLHLKEEISKFEEELSVN